MNTTRYIDQLILFDAVRNDEIAGCISELMYSTDSNLEKILNETYYTTQRILLKNIGHGGEITGNYLQDHLCRIIAGEENVFTRMSEDGIFKNLKRNSSVADITQQLDYLPKSVLLLAASEIKIISQIYSFDFVTLTGSTDGRNVAAAPAISPLRPLSHRDQIHKLMTQGKSLDAAILLSRFYHSYGSGVFEAAPALTAEADGLVPIRQHDPITMDDLVGYEGQKQMLIDNIDILMAGLPANNLLLYGDSGTGKSSSVKALLNMYEKHGLKMINVSKDKLDLIPAILDKISDRGMKFIIFIDDLSFEENENEYKTFKSIIEGRVIARPKNTIFIVTTNRKNIVKEVWDDRSGGNDVRRHDNMEEKRSLADRFGISIIYSAPDKNEYLAIVKGIAEKSGLSLPEDELFAEALKWEIRHGGRSGRTARQFVDYMIGIEHIK